MNLKGEYWDRKIIEVLVFISAIIVPSFVLIWGKLNPDMPMCLKAIAWIVALLCVLLYCLIYVSSFVRRNLAYFFYSICYLVSGYVVHTAYLYNFTEGYSLLLMLVVFYIALTFQKMTSLLYYLMTILGMVIFAISMERTYKGVYDNTSLIIGICLIFFSIIAVLNLFIRNEDKKALKESKRDYQRLLDIFPDGIVVYEQDKIVYANEAIAKLSEVEDRDSFVGKSIFEFIHPKDHEQMVSDMEEMWKNCHREYSEDKINLFCNKSIDVEIANIVTSYNDRAAIMTIIRDITERKRMEEELIEAEAKYRNIVEAALVGVYLIQNDRLIYINKYFEDTFEYDVKELYNMNFMELISNECKNLVIDGIQRLLSGSKESMMEIKAVKKDGSNVYLQTHSKFMIYQGVPSIMGMLLNITERKLAEEKINQMALYDSVTLLPNRYFFNFTLKNKLEASNKSGQSVALMFIDLDRFKVINDTMGHTLGDAVLQKASQEIKTCLHEDDFMARYGGDEFIIILENVSFEGAKETAQRIIKRFSNSFTVDGHIIDITPSIGISFYPKDCSDSETLIKNADTAMYQAKSIGRNNYKFYNSEMNNEFSRKIQIEVALRKALQNDEFMVYYQPQIDLITRQICGAEALIRWNHPKLGMVPPNEFIPLAEETGLIIPIGEWVLKTACMQSKAWRDMGLKPFSTAVNISYEQLKHKGFTNLIQKTLKESGLEPEFLELEITETVLKDIEQLKRVLDELSPIGIKLSVDDFGVGYSSLSMLQHINIDNLKIDRSFIKDIEKNTKAAAIVKTIINMGKYLNCSITAEGIETKEQLDFLKENNCNIGQGFLFSKPLDPKDFEKLFK